MQTSLPPSPEKTNLLKKVEECQEETAKLSLEKQQLGAQLSDKSRLVDQLIARNNSLEKTVDELELGVNDLKVRVSGLKDEVATRMNSNEELKAELASKADIMRQLQADNVKAEVMVGTLRGEKAGFIFFFLAQIKSKITKNF